MQSFKFLRRYGFVGVTPGRKIVVEGCFGELDHPTLPEFFPVLSKPGVIFVRGWIELANTQSEDAKQHRSTLAPIEQVTQYAGNLKRSAESPIYNFIYGIIVIITILQV